MDIFCLYIRVKIKADMVDEFKQRFNVLAKHVKDNEPLTLSCASQSQPRPSTPRETFSRLSRLDSRDSDDTSLSTDVPFRALSSCPLVHCSQTSCARRTKPRTSS